MGDIVRLIHYTYIYLPKGNIFFKKSTHFEMTSGPVKIKLYSMRILKSVL